MGYVRRFQPSGGDIAHQLQVSCVRIRRIRMHSPRWPRSQPTLYATFHVEPDRETLEPTVSSG